MPTHPAITRQAARQVSTGETTKLPAPAYYQQNQAVSGTSVYGPLGNAVIIHVEGAAGQNAGVNQIATQDPNLKAALDEAVKENNFLTKIGALI